MYRYRSIQRLINDKELQNQEICFTAPTLLNDPMEGLSDLVFNSDIRTWAGVLQHYLLCLYNTIKKVSIDDSIEITIFNPDAYLPNYDDISTKIKRVFFSQKLIHDFIQILPNRDIKSDELTLYLLMIHPTAILSCLIPIFFNENFQFESNDIFSLYKSMIEEGKINNVFFSETLKAAKSRLLISRYNSQQTLSDSERFIQLDFTKQYMSKIIELIFPNWYTACFSKDCTNSSLWGQYGDKHTGICLKFFSRSNGILKLHDTNGLIKKLKFNKVYYKNESTKIDFFKLLEQTIADLNLYDSFFDVKHKTNSNSGVQSEQIKFFNCVTTKTIDWKYEKEYRLIVTEGPKKACNVDLLKYNYDFIDLESIIFGSNTSDDNKIKIIDIIKKKCIEHNRKEFQFYQAEYNANHSKLEIYKLDLPLGI